MFIRRLPHQGDGPEYIGVHVAANLIMKYLQKPIDGYKIVIKRDIIAGCKTDVVLRNFFNLLRNRENLIGVLGPCKSFK